MQKLTAATLRGNWATLLLPINADQSINYALLADEIDLLIAAGVDGIYSNGTAGEFYNQTEDEFNSINELLSQKCLAAGMRFQIGASHPSPIISMERARRSIGLKPDAIQVILPDWVACTPTEQVDFLQDVATATEDIPLMLYNPPRAKTVLKPAEFGVLKAAVPQLIGIKVLSGDDEWVAAMKKYATGLSVFVPGHLLASGVKNGIASGAYSNVACINAKAAQQWWWQMQTNIEAALDVEQRIQQFFKQCIAPLQQRGFSDPALDKFLAAVGGCTNVGTRLRRPYKFIDESGVLPARRIAQRLIPEFFN